MLQEKQSDLRPQVHSHDRGDQTQMSRETFMSKQFENELSEMKAFIATGGEASNWFAKAYISWYWATDFWKVNLNGYEYLDSLNKRLFVRMLNLRELDGRSDSALHEVALFAVEKLNLPPSQTSIHEERHW